MSRARSPRGPNIVAKLRDAGQLVEALAFVLGHPVDETKTAAVRCLEPAHHEHGDDHFSAVIEPTAGRVECKVTGATWGLLQIGVLRGYGATEAEVARLLEERLLGKPSAAPHGAADSIRRSGEALPAAGEPEWPYYPKTAVNVLGWELVRASDGRPGLRLPTWKVDGTRGRTKRRYRKRPDKRYAAEFEDDGDESGLINLPALVEASAGLQRPRVALVCGETDLLAWTHNALAEGIDVPAISHSTGESSTLEPYLGVFRGVRVYFFPDTDAAGRAAAPKRVAELRSVGVAVHVGYVPAPHKDVCDFLRAGGTVSALLEGGVATKPVVSGSELEVSIPLPPEAVPRWRPFPVSLLPSPVDRYVLGRAKALGCDPAFVALPALAGLAASVGNARAVELKAGWCEPCVLWTATIAESGGLKSPAFDAGLAPLRRRQERWLRSHDLEIRDHETDILRHKSEVAQWRKGGADGDPPRSPAAPKPRRILVSDTTVEALAAVLEHAPKGLLLAREELSGWFGSFNEYKTRRGSDESQWLTMHGARLLIVDRKSALQGPIHIARAAVSITGTIQPAILQSVLGREHFDSGLAARLLLAWPPRGRKRWTEAVVDPDIEEAYDTLVGRLLDLRPNQDEFGGAAPLRIPLDAEAREEWVRFYDRHGARQDDATGDEAAMLAKVEGTAARLGLLFHVIRSVGDEGLTLSLRVDRASLAAGIEIAEWFAYEAERVYEAFRTTPEVREQQDLVTWVERRGGRVTSRDLTLGPRRFRRDPESAREALDRLVARGLGTWVAGGVGDRGGRPTEYFVLAHVADAFGVATESKPPDSSLDKGVSSPPIDGEGGTGA